MIWARDCRRKRLADLIAPDLEIGVEPSPGVGSRWTHLPVARAIVKEACRALAELGRTCGLDDVPRRAAACARHRVGVSLLRDHGVKALAPFNAILRELLGNAGVDHAAAFRHIDDLAERKEMQDNLAPRLSRRILRDVRGPALRARFGRCKLHAIAAVPAGDAERELGAEPRVRRHSAGSAALARELDLISYAMGWHALNPFPGYTGRPSARRAKRATTSRT